METQSGEHGLIVLARRRDGPALPTSSSPQTKAIGGRTWRQADGQELPPQRRTYPCASTALTLERVLTSLSSLGKHPRRVRA